MSDIAIFGSNIFADGVAEALHILEFTLTEGEFGSMNERSLREIRNSKHKNSPSDEVPAGSGESDSETDHNGLESLDAELEAALMESPTLRCR